MSNVAVARVVARIAELPDTSDARESLPEVSGTASNRAKAIAIGSTDAAIRGGA
jgi:hypothetical protein